MTSKEAFILLVQNDIIKGRDVVSCIEYPSMFVFQALTKDNKNEMDSLFFINKKSKQFGVFIPWKLPIKEYKNFKIIKDFK